MDGIENSKTYSIVMEMHGKSMNFFSSLRRGSAQGPPGYTSFHFFVSFSLSLYIYICMSGMSLIQDVGIIEIMWWSLRIARCCITWGLRASSGVQQTTGIVVKSQLRCGPPRQSIQVPLFSYFVHLFMSRKMCWKSHTHLFLSLYIHTCVYIYIHTGTVDGHIF